MDLKKDWPIGLAVLLIVLAVIEYRSSGGTTTMVPSGPSDPGSTGSVTSGPTGNPAAVGLVGQYLQYLAALGGQATARYTTFVGAGAAGYQATQGAEIAADYYATQARIAQLQRPSWLQQFTSFLQGAAQAYATYQSGGMYRPPSGSTSYGYPNYGGQSIGSLPTIGQEYGYNGTFSTAPPVPVEYFGGNG